MGLSVAIVEALWSRQFAETSPLSARRRHDLLIYLAVVYHPTYDMPTLRVMVRPMDGPAFLVPDTLAVEAGHCRLLQVRLVAGRCRCCE